MAHWLTNRVWQVSLGGLLLVAAEGCGQDFEAVAVYPIGTGTLGGGAGVGSVPAVTAGSGGAGTTQGGAGTTQGGAGTTQGGAGTTQGGTSGTTLSFGGVPKAGDVVQNPTPGGPAGTVTNVYSASSGNSWVYVSYPPEWSCPTNASSAASSACLNGGAETASPTEGALLASSCSDMAALRKPALIADSRRLLCAAHANWVREKCEVRNTSFCVSSSGVVQPSRSCQTWTATGGASSISLGTQATNSSATSYSTTNTQVAAVDEADYVKNDGNSIFVLGGNALHVLDAWPATETREVLRLPIPGEPRRLFFSDNRLVVYSRLSSNGTSGAGSSNPSDQGCTYGYGCRFSSEGGHALAIVYDVTTPSAPQELVRYEFSGGYVASRRVGSYVYTVLHDAGAPQLPGLDFTLMATSFDELETAYQLRLASLAQKITDTPAEYFLPWQKTTYPDGTTSTQSDCSQAWRGSEARGMSFVSLNAFDLTKLAAPTRTVLGSSPGFVYASPTSLYMAVDLAPEPTSATGFISSSYTTVKNSVVHKFALDGTQTTYRGSAKLPGHILNQFAMDEYQGVLRVASTAGWVPDPATASYVTTFAEKNGSFTQLGQVGGIAPTEDIRAIRFDQDRGYVVTFKKTDPLFVFDLGDSAAPKAMGELKIPGFSTYIHRLDNSHLLAIGFEADDQGSFAYFNGIQIQIFDVTDLSAPSLMWKHVIGTRGSGSEALSNHLAFNYFAPKKLLALPITVCEGGGNGTYGDTLTFAGLMVFDVSLETGIKEHGRLPFLDPTAVAPTVSCGSWWTDARSLVKRSIFMDDWVYGLSDGQLRVAGLASMSQPVATVALTSN